jgi:hypothetical protein
VLQGAAGSGVWRPGAGSGACNLITTDPLIPWASAWPRAAEIQLGSAGCRGWGPGSKELAV